MSKSQREGLGHASDTPPDIEEILGGAAPAGAKSKARRARAGKSAAGAPARERRLPQSRFVAIALVFVATMGGALVRFADLAAEGEFASEQGVASVLREVEDDAKPQKRGDLQLVSTGAPTQRAPRAPIVDRNGQPLARDLTTYELYLDAQAFALRDKKFPQVDRAELAEAAAAIAAAFPNRFEADALARLLMKKRTTLLARPLTAQEAQRAHDLGISGLYLRPRLDRYYPAGALAAHVLGYVDIDGVGKAGVEAGLDARLVGTPETPLRLSLDLRAQRVVREALRRGMEETGAKAASGVVLSAETGEVLALVSLPDFNPHHRPASPGPKEDPEDSPLFFRSVIGQYELGSVMKIVTWALALETGARMSDSFPALPALHVGDLDLRPEQAISFPRAFAKSSNRIAAELVLKAGRSRQEALFEALGFFADTPLEVGGASLSARKRTEWSEANTVTSSYGYGIQISPLHMAAAVASLVNGGELVRPTLVPQEARLSADRVARPRLRVVKAETSRLVRELLRLAVDEGTGTRAASAGLRVGGKTGTAEKPDERGVYQENGPGRATFVGVFPIERPELVVTVMLDEPSVEHNGAKTASAGLTAAPVARAIIEGVAPLAGIAQRSVAAATLLGAPEVPQPIALR